MKKVLVICADEDAKNQIAAGYLRFYGHNFLEVFPISYSLSNQDLAYKVMLEDGINIAQSLTYTFENLSTQEFDFSIIITTTKEIELPTALESKKKLVWKLKGNMNKIATSEQQLQYFQEVREQLKTLVVKFVGKELLVSSDYLFSLK
jgi:arsenate reductase